MHLFSPLNRWRKCRKNPLKKFEPIVCDESIPPQEREAEAQTQADQALNAETVPLVRYD
jgi:hypothetical protein